MAADDTTREGDRTFGRLIPKPMRTDLTPIGKAARETEARRRYVGGRGGAVRAQARRRGAR